MVLANLLMIHSCAPCFGDSVPNLKPVGHRFNLGDEVSVMLNSNNTLSVNLEGKESYTTQPVNFQLNRGDLFQYDSGQSIIWLLANNFYGTLSSNDVASLSTPALAFFRKGRLSKSYSLQELLVRESLVQQSTSHTTWIADIWKNKRRIKNPVLSGNRLTLTTTSFRQYSFNVETGELIAKSDTPFWAKSEIIIFGKFKMNSKGNCTPVTCGIAKTISKDLTDLQFSCKSQHYCDGSFHIVGLVRKKRGWTTVEDSSDFNWLLNLLAQQPVK